MPIIYDLVFKNNKRIPLTGPCFGAFSRTSFPEGWIRRNYFERLRMDSDAGRRQCQALYEDFGNAEFIQYYPEPEEAWKHTGFWEEGSDPILNYFSEMRLLLDEMPFLKASVHPLLKVIRVKVNGVPADKVMMTLFLLRNLTQYYGISYMYLRKEFGLKPKAAAILSSLWCRSSLSGMRARTHIGYYYTQLGEYNWLSPKTFGKEGLNQLLTNADNPDWNPWVQQGFTQIPGYHRDSWFAGKREFYFNGRNRVLVDCLSVQRDDDIWCGAVRTTGFDTKEHFEQRVLNPFVNLCREYGYEPIQA